MYDVLMLCLAAHLCGDFLLQNHAMQKKGQDTLVCLWHISFYAIPFCCLWAAGLLSPASLVLILVQHFLQDRFQLHIKWMRLIRQTPPEVWPTGPLCVDQAWHIVSIVVFVSLFG